MCELQTFSQAPGCGPGGGSDLLKPTNPCWPAVKFYVLPGIHPLLPSPAAPRKRRLSVSASVLPSHRFPLPDLVNFLLTSWTFSLNRLCLATDAGSCLHGGQALRGSIGRPLNQKFIWQPALGSLRPTQVASNAHTYFLTNVIRALCCVENT